MIINSSFNNPFNKPLNNNIKNKPKIQQNYVQQSYTPKKEATFGNYYSVGRGQKPQFRRMAEEALEASGDVSNLLNAANQKLQEAMRLLLSGDPAQKAHAESMKWEAEQMQRDINEEVAAYNRRREMLASY